jgi:putative nucleotidyltransferase with HDIG domain
MSAVFGSGRLAVVDDVRRGGMPGAEIHAAVGVRSVALAKMTRSGRPVGVLAALSMDERRAFSPEDLQILCGVADETTQAVASAQLLCDTERRLRMTQGLRNIDIAIAGSMDLRVTLSVILHETVRQLAVDAAAVLLLDRRTQTLAYAAGHGFHGRRIAESRLRIGDGHAGRVALDRTTLRVSLIVSPCRQRAELLEGEGFESYCGLPLIAKGEVCGVLEIFHRARLEPDAEWSEFAEALAGQAAIAIDSATLFTDLQRVNANLVQAYDSTLEGWSRALDLRDRETEGHTQRVTDLALTLAREIGIHEDELVHLRRGAMLHDIGKMGIPDSILLKPGPLNDDEWRVMRQHPVLAYELLTPISYLRPAIDIPYCHHERWDGTGYPRGLRGDEIPLAARIFAVVDVWDALLSDRPYRRAWSGSSARQYISSLSGAHFDPDIVDAFERVYLA